MPAKTAQPSIYGPLSDYQQIVLDAINIERMKAQKDSDKEIQKAIQQFEDIAFTYRTSMLYYEDYDTLTAEQKMLMQQGMEAFGGIAPTYKIRLLDKPTIVWDFHSLMLGVQMMFSFMLTDQDKPIRICKHCSEVFVASRPSAVFCSPQCKNKHSVYKNRAKDKKDR